MKRDLEIKDKKGILKGISVEILKKNFEYIIWIDSVIQGSNLTEIDTYRILNNLKVSNLHPVDLQVVLNLKTAYRWLITEYNKELTIDFVKKIHSMIGSNLILDAGELRKGDVGIFGTNLERIPPVEENVFRRKLWEIEIKISKKNKYREAAIETFLWICRNQPFYDGNKRTAMIVANKILLSGNQGILALTSDKIENFHVYLKKYYNHGEPTNIVKLLEDSIVDWSNGVYT